MIGRMFGPDDERQRYRPTASPTGWGSRIGNLLRGIGRGMVEHPVETAIDFSPLGDAKAVLYDAPRAAMAGDRLGLGLALASAIPGIPGLRRVGDSFADAARTADNLTPEGRFSPEFLRENYPVAAEPEMKVDRRKGTTYAGRGIDAPNSLFMEDRRAIQAELDAGNYSPYFDPAARYDANPANYVEDAHRSTAEGLAKKESTLREKAAQYDTPEIRQRFRDAYQFGSLDPNADRWYQMGQLEDEAIRLLGPEEGPKWFRKNFAEAMAATTAGNDPQANLMMAGYTNWRHARDLPVPVAHAIPRPTQGQYLANNAKWGEAAKTQGLPPANNPKGFSFSRNFMGEDWRATMDKQITRGSGLNMDAPQNNAYAIFEGTLADEARLAGLAPRDFQDVAWAGFKNAKDAGYTPAEALAAIERGESIPFSGKPMIAHVNEAIERTARLTNQTPQEVVRRWITLNAPLFSGAGLLGVMAARNRREERGG